MTNTDITKIRQLLSERVAVAKVSADNENYLIRFSIKDAESILALLPCETCGGTGVKYCTPKSGNTIVVNGFNIPCPDCQS